MKRLVRLPLSAVTTAFLQRRTARVIAAKNRHAAARRLWKRQRNKAFRELRGVLAQMAPGVQHCMYCENSEGTDIDHFRPRSRYPRLAFRWENYLLACSGCNSNHKRDLFPRDPATGRRLLIDPTRDDPRRHLTLSPSTGLYAHRTLRGANSITVFGLNRPTLATARADAWIAVQALIDAYAQCRKVGATQVAARHQQALCRFPHASVFAALVQVSQCAVAHRYVTPACLRALQQHPEVLTWV